MTAGHVGGGVLITGGASGIGRAVAERFAVQGAAVTVGDRDVDAAEELAATLRADGHRAQAVACDVTDHEQLAGAARAAEALGGQLGVVVGNAGLLRTAPLSELSVADFEDHLRVNLTANLVLAQLTAPALARAGGGAILFTASLGGLRGTAGSASYNASKGGLVNLTRSLADELAPTGTRVNCLCPGWIDTPFNAPFWDHAGADERARVEAGIPLRRQGTPEDVAPAAVFLCGPGATYITGQTLVIDGGVQAT